MALDFRRADFVLFRALLGEILWPVALKRGVVQESWLDTQWSLSSSSRKDHPNKEEIKQIWMAWRSKGVLTELRRKKEVYKRCKQEQVTQEGYRSPDRSCIGGLRKAKAGLELHLKRSVHSNNKRFCEHINIKRKTRENMGPLLNGAVKLVRNNRNA